MSYVASYGWASGAPHLNRQIGHLGNPCEVLALQHNDTALPFGNRSDPEVIVADINVRESRLAALGLRLRPKSIEQLGLEAAIPIGNFPVDRIDGDV